MPTFKHSGSIGDVIYSLPAVKALGGGEIRLDVNGKAWWKHLFGDPVAQLAPLLEAQPYITGVTAWDGKPVDYDLDLFRECFWHPHLPKILTLADLHTMSVGLPAQLKDEKWLTIEPSDYRPACVIHRSARYHSPFFNWRMFVEDHPGSVFTGLAKEHEDFEARFGKIEHVPTANLLELARLIAGADMFAGNQSSPYSIAEGLKKKAVLEASPEVPNCMFYRPGVVATAAYGEDYRERLSDGRSELVEVT